VSYTRGGGVLEQERARDDHRAYRPTQRFPGSVPSHPTPAVPTSAVRKLALPLWVTAVAAVLIAIDLVAVTVLLTSGWASSAPDREPATTSTSVLPATALPWPKEGQSAVTVEGLGSLGTMGEQTPVPIASVTKVMTAYVILADHPLDGGESGPLITVDRAAAEESTSPDESTAPVREGQRFTERQLLELMLIPSGNNIARLLARWDAGSEDAFVAKMNAAADDVGMTHTTYTGASGLEPTTTSTAVDQLKLAQRVMHNDVIASIVAKPSTTVPGVAGTIRNTNTLVGRDGVIGLKTGSSTPAGGALMWAANADAGGKTWLVLGVVLHQHAGTNPREGLDAVLDNSRTLIIAAQKSLASALAAGQGR
jgi:D-alanyl-D-alanine carboxypeptidase (penicillin-binding protein 5/6)